MHGSTVLPKILFVAVSGTRAQGRSLFKLTHLHHRPQIHLWAQHASHMHSSTHAKTWAYAKKYTGARTLVTQAVCTHSTGSAHCMWACAKINSLPQRTRVKRACMKKHKKHFAPHKNMIQDCQSWFKSCPYWWSLESSSRITNFHLAHGMSLPLTCYATWVPISLTER